MSGFAPVTSHTDPTLTHKYGKFNCTANKLCHYQQWWCPFMCFYMWIIFISNWFRATETLCVLPLTPTLKKNAHFMNRIPLPFLKITFFFFPIGINASCCMRRPTPVARSHTNATGYMPTKACHLVMNMCQRDREGCLLAIGPAPIASQWSVLPVCRLSAASCKRACPQHAHWWEAAVML